MHNRESLHKRNELFAPDTSYLRKWTPLLYTHVGIICTLFAQVAVLSTQASTLFAHVSTLSTRADTLSAQASTLSALVATLSTQADTLFAHVSTLSTRADTLSAQASTYIHKRCHLIYTSRHPIRTCCNLIYTSRHSIARVATLSSFKNLTSHTIVLTQTKKHHPK